ncbi:hypothetical protein L211DRAFT_839702 [Terfezia boudieri ATCC MYA-4762]|uniref:SPRY domain-containing protein n=1 Tax=Terfezia boudieri ATCC MYA-4762 TaxID=1051890 RepID=A0A3N4LHJ8_9PEZI|nr:hypothetical protein L211DRAFT_839702 [Terfezia boudieri ATCC MYA-4762]
MSWFKRLGEKAKGQPNTSSANPYQEQNSYQNPAHQYSTSPGYGLGSSTYSADYAPPSQPPPDLSTDTKHPYPIDKKNPTPQNEHEPDEPPPAYSAVPPGFSAPTAAPPACYPSISFSAPPSIHYTFSPTNNSTRDAFAAGERFCSHHPLAPPLVSVWDESLTRITEGDVTMHTEPPCNRIEINTSFRHPTTTSIKIIKKRCPDSTILSQVPLYLARYHHPSVANQTVVIGYHLSIVGLPLDGDSVVAMGFACVPYPQYRLPGWHRGSLAIHSDDGRRYCNDGYGGVEFTRPFSQGDQLALALVMRWVTVPGGAGMVESEVKFMRNGRREGGWMVQERVELGRPDPTVGLLGERDIFAAVGVTGGKGVEVVVRVMGGEEARSLFLEVLA